MKIHQKRKNIEMYYFPKEIALKNNYYENFNILKSIKKTEIHSRDAPKN